MMKRYLLVTLVLFAAPALADDLQEQQTICESHYLRGGWKPGWESCAIIAESFRQTEIGKRKQKELEKEEADKAKINDAAKRLAK